jgi:hypothetical protein
MSIWTVGTLKSDRSEFSLTSAPWAFAFLFLVVWRLFSAICGSSEPFGLFAICLTRNFGALVLKLL